MKRGLQTIVIGCAALFLPLSGCGDPGEIPFSVLGYGGGEGPGSNAERGSVLITEVGWAGSLDDAGNYHPEDVFIELQNKGFRPVNMSRWEILLTGARERTWLIPESDREVFPNEYIVIASTQTRAFPDADFLLPDFTIPKSHWEITIRDKDRRLIEPVGNIDGPPFAGGYDLVTVRSMERSQVIFGNFGTLQRNWHYFTENVGRGKIAEGFRKFTLGSPGEANSRDYSGSSSSGNFE
ncbi:MAG: hypothetical protein D6795_08045 [Deltaproteobacteria bacterium]|nr:MAG: hypothetical protein D6795_08045 [Deltaproteobacteria bacterium]